MSVSNLHFGASHAATNNDQDFNITLRLAFKGIEHFVRQLLEERFGDFDLALCAADRAIGLFRWMLRTLRFAGMLISSAG